MRLLFYSLGITRLSLLIFLFEGVEKVLEFAKALPFEMPSTNALPVTVEEFILETERQTGKVNYTKVVIQVRRVKMVNFYV